MTQAEVAVSTGISQPNLSAYERDRRLPSADTLNKIVVACGYQLAATDDRTVIHCPLPIAGWPTLPDDPRDERPVLAPDATPEERAAALVAVIELAEATR